jgi:hypothetical protein
MSLDPPNGSKISVTTDGAEPLIVVPHAKPGASRYVTGFFLLILIGIWYFGFSHSISVLWSGNANVLFLVWLLLWTAVGAFPVYCLYRLFGPAVPESLRLRQNGIAYDSGIPPLQVSYRGGITPDEVRKVYFPKRTRVELDRPQLASLHLRETDSGNKLTVDAGAERLEIARAAGEIEREWLYRTLAERYSLSTAPGGTVEPQA